MQRNLEKRGLERKINMNWILQYNQSYYIVYNNQSDEDEALETWMNTFRLRPVVCPLLRTAENTDSKGVWIISEN
jgi:hypothetical protein